MGLHASWWSSSSKTSPTSSRRGRSPSIDTRASLLEKSAVTIHSRQGEDWAATPVEPDPHTMDSPSPSTFKPITSISTAMTTALLAIIQVLILPRSSAARSPIDR